MTTAVDVAGMPKTSAPNEEKGRATMDLASVCPTLVGIPLHAIPHPKADPAQAGEMLGIVNGTHLRREVSAAEVLTTNFGEGLWTRENGKKNKFVWTEIGTCPPRVVLLMKSSTRLLNMTTWKASDRKSWSGSRSRGYPRSKPNT